jgi:hypothetical protein
MGRNREYLGTYRADLVVVFQLQRFVKEVPRASTKAEDVAFKDSFTS